MLYVQAIEISALVFEEHSIRVVLCLSVALNFSLDFIYDCQCLAQIVFYVLSDNSELFKTSLCCFDHLIGHVSRHLDACMLTALVHLKEPFFCA